MHPNKYTHISDNELLHLYYKYNENKWIGILLQRYTLLLLGTCMKYLKNEEEAKDAVQQIFLKVITELKKSKVEYFKSWIYIIARNYCLMQLRNKNILVEPTEENLQDTDNSDDIIEELFKKETLLTALEIAIEQLNEEQKKCITLFYLQQNSYQQIANTTGFSLLQVKSFIQNGKRNLKLLIQKNNTINLHDRP